MTIGKWEVGGVASLKKIRVANADSHLVEDKLARLETSGGSLVSGDQECK